MTSDPIYCRAWPSVLPSCREGMPRTIIEALAFGRPVDGVNDRLRRSLPRHPTALALAVQRLSEDLSIGRRMGAVSRAISEQRFDVEKVSAAVMRAMSLRSATLPGTI